MHKKLMMACMAIAAFAAFVIAPAASASPVLTEGGVAVPVGASITGINIGPTEFSGGFNVVCSSAHLTGTVTKNSGTKVTGEIPVGSAKFTGTGTGGDCTSALGNVAVNVTSKLCLETTTEDKGLVTGCGANVTFDLTITNVITCKYSVASVAATHTTAPTDARVNVNNQPASEEEPRSAFCPDTGTLKMEFELQTTGGATLTFS